MNVYESFTDLIGNTPLLELKGIEKKEKLEAKLLAKLEYFTPAGSVKDRIAKAMIDEAEAKGLAWVKFDEENNPAGGIAKFIDKDKKQKLQEKGANILVVGTSIINSENYTNTINEFKK